MKIDYLQINGFGKLKDKLIDLDDGINIIYGENEAGKSSLLKFTSSMLYGANKLKMGKEISDQEKFVPWSGEEYSGKIRYKLENGEEFEVYRDFKKKKAIIYNKEGEDITSTFNIGKGKGAEFFEKQTGIDEDTFLSTAITEQDGIILSKTSQGGILQKISNLITSGDDKISYKKSLEKITKGQTEEVGTERTSQRPLNIVLNKIKVLTERKNSLEKYRAGLNSKSIDQKALKKEKEEKEGSLKFLKEYKESLDVTKVKRAEITFNRNLEKEYEERIDKLNKELSDESLMIKKLPNKYKKLYWVVLALIIITLLSIPLKIGYLYKYALGLVAILMGLIVIVLDRITTYKNAKQVREDDLEKNRIMNEIDFLKKNKESQRIEANMKEQKLDQEIDASNHMFIAKYKKKLDEDYIIKTIDKSYDELLRDIDRIESRLKTIDFKLHTIEQDNKNLSEKIGELAQTEEELQNLIQEREELLSLNNSYNIAKEALETAYKKVRTSISPRFTSNLCDIISKISDGRYSKVAFNDQSGLVVEVENGTYIPASRLSMGTIDQMYISLRLSALNEITDESLPIMLDEAFAYFDNQRLLNMLRYLHSNFPDTQILIFTCSNREEELLKQLKIDYNLIKLENKP